MHLECLELGHCSVNGGLVCFVGLQLANSLAVLGSSCGEGLGSWSILLIKCGGWCADFGCRGRCSSCDSNGSSSHGLRHNSSLMLVLSSQLQAL